MTDWKAVALAVARLEGRVWTDFAELALDRRWTWDALPAEIARRGEAAQQAMVNEWRAAGVATPLMLFGAMSAASTALWTLALMKAPGRTLRMTGALCLLGALYGASNVLAQRRQAGQAPPATEPAAMPEHEAGPYRAAEW